MKTILTFIMSLVTFISLSQNTFLRSYDFYDRMEADAAFIDTDGYVVGACAIIGSENFLVLIKTNHQGDTVWTKKYSINRSTFISSYATDASGTKIINVQQMGGLNNVFMFDNYWNLTYNGTLGVEYTKYIKILNDGNFLVVVPEPTYRLYKVNSQTKEVIWEGDSLKQYYYFTIENILEDNEGNIFISTKNHDFIGNGNGTTFYKLNSIGKIVNHFNFNYFILGTTVYENNNFYSLTYRDNLQANAYNSLITFNSDGVVIDSINITTANISFRRFIQDGDKKILAGITMAGIERINALGCFKDNQIVWTRTHGNPDISNEDYYPYGITKTTDGGYLVVGTYRKLSSKYTAYLLKTDSDGMISTLGLEENLLSEDFLIYPNPAKEYITIKNLRNLSNAKTIEIYNANGKLISNQPFAPNKTISVTDLESGLYFLRIIKINEIEIIKFVKS